MQMKNYMAVMISLAVSVILVVGVLVPVIADNSSNDNNGTGGYTNTGEYYYRLAEEGENHTIEVANTGTAITITYDDVLFKTLEMGNESWIVPLIMYNTDTNTDDKAIKYLTEVGDSTDVSLWNSVYIGLDILNPNVSKKYTIQGSDISYDDNPIIENSVYMYLSNEDSDDYVLSKTPVVDNPDEHIWIADAWGEFGLKTDSEDAWSKTVSDFTRTTLEQLPDYNQDTTPCNLEAYSVPDYAEQETFDVTLNTSSVDSGTKIDSLVLHITMDDDSVWNTTFTQFVVPTQAGGGSESGSSGGMSPTLSAMLSVIPLIVVVGLIIGTVAYFIRRQ